MNTYQNPFITSAEVYAENDFFDREEVLREIEKFIEREKDYNFLLSGQRRIGKTSVLKKIEKLHNNNNSKAILFNKSFKSVSPSACRVIYIAFELLLL